MNWQRIHYIICYCVKELLVHVVLHMFIYTNRCQPGWLPLHHLPYSRFPFRLCLLSDWQSRYVEHRINMHTYYRCTAIVSVSAIFLIALASGSNAFCSNFAVHPFTRCSYADDTCGSNYSVATSGPASYRVSQGLNCTPTEDP